MFHVDVFTFVDTYNMNPQFKVTVTDADDDDDENVGTLVIGLMQKGRRRMFSQGQGNYTIGYEIWEVRIYTMTMAITSA